MYYCIYIYIYIILCIMYYVYIYLYIYIIYSVLLFVLCVPGAMEDQLSNKIVSTKVFDKEVGLLNTRRPELGQ